jgi:hypothetical protein
LENPICRLTYTAPARINSSDALNVAKSRETEMILAIFTLSACWKVCATCWLAGFRSNNSDLYCRLDRLLTQLASPNLHDLGLEWGCLRIEVWDRYGKDNLRYCIAAIGNISIAQVAFDEALKQYPNDRLTLRKGIMLIRDSEREGQGRS